MSTNYSQWKAMLAISKASFRAIFRSPSAVIFSFAFPLIFILVFGFIGGGSPTVRIGFTKTTDTTQRNAVYQQLSKYKTIRIVEKSEEELKNDLSKGRITALIDMQPNKTDTFPLYNISIQTSTASVDRLAILQSTLKDIIVNIDRRAAPDAPTYAKIELPPPMPGRVYKTIDFILPGQLGFSLLSAGVFGVAFLFFNLRQQLVLKRFFATPIKRGYILFGEGISRVLFQLITAVVILLIGRFVFGFTLVHGAVTFIELLLLSLVGLIVFMGFGFIVSGLAKNESTIPPFANMFTLPQFLLAGTFFSIDTFPKWLQPICRILPLTHLNDAMRNIAFEGSHLIDCGKQLGILGIWGVVLYAVAIKVFKWE
ncbi:ABC-2 type transport system permease protein [Lacibacter cauensis]|uniref:Transport permease protein n=1 Tax=Lacibacter cauensis TaxID=510947 RepID=A0A562SFU7_9BACT|nr:ABC transporter permease [Lacibacter cauensis]TWI80227.1 ABC-2 type transport system permease protein [Lacibacter cauensis]